MQLQVAVVPAPREGSLFALLEDCEDKERTLVVPKGLGFPSILLSLMILRRAVKLLRLFLSTKKGQSFEVAVWLCSIPATRQFMHVGMETLSSIIFC